jgi:GR25 family glycosyltransferase involved in LPS biosynthesis
MNNFKRRFVINLERRSDRYLEFLNRIPFDKNLIERYNAIDGKDIKTKHDNPYVVGCHLSHKNILNIVANDDSLNDDDLIIIFEDDVFFSDNNFEKEIVSLFDSIKYIESKHFIIYIGGRFTPNFNPILKRWKHIANRLYHKKGEYRDYRSSDYDRTAHVIILNKLTCKTIIEKTKNVDLSMPIDTLYNNIRNYEPDLQIYDIFPHLCYSPADYKTDIQNFKK